MVFRWVVLNEDNIVTLSVIQEDRAVVVAVPVAMR